MAADVESREDGSAEPFVAEPVAYVVGYGRPPVATRFRPGQSGNPRGSQKGVRHVATILAAVLAERVTVKEGRRRRNITKLEAAIKQVVNRAAAGDIRATQWLIALAEAHEAKPSRTDAEFDSEADAAVIAVMMRRLTERP